ncbi:hypothetical protein BV497_05540 [Fulvimonas soli]|nr:hypothetical protein BV497_05540 [Fulvimonas soli]
MEINQCASSALEAETAAINSVYNRYRIELSAAQKQQLKDVQLAWIRYKDLACNYNASELTGGSMQPYVIAQCLTEQTIIRRKQLEALLNCESGTTPGCPISHQETAPKSQPQSTDQAQASQRKNDATQTTPYGNCPQRAEVYQKRYESLNQSSDLVCYQKALERELSDEQSFSCPLSAQYYQTAYERNLNASDLVCYQQALERELN